MKLAESFDTNFTNVNLTPGWLPMLLNHPDVNGSFLPALFKQMIGFISCVKKLEKHLQEIQAERNAKVTPGYPFLSELDGSP